MTRHLETAVRDAAFALRAAIADAEAAGLVVTLPRRAADLGAIAISTSAKAESWPVALMVPPAAEVQAPPEGEPLRLAPDGKPPRRR